MPSSSYSPRTSPRSAIEEVIGPLGHALTIAAGLLLGAGLILRDLRRGALLATALVVFWFGFGHLARLLGPGVSRDVQLVIWGMLVAAALGGAILLRERWIAAVTRLLDVVVTVLLGITVLRVLGSELTRPVASSRLAPAEPRRLGDRDIYFLVWDRYGSRAAVGQLGAGLDGIEDWLEARGFSVARDAHANYGRTVLSLAATLNMTPLDDVAARLGPDSDDPTPVHALLQDHAVGRFLKARGYRYLHIGSWFAPTRTSSLADENLVMADGSDFEAKLEETTFQPTLDDLLGVPDPPAHHVLHRTTALWQLREFDVVYREPGPKFVLLHVLLPHEPYVFDEVGDYPTEAQREARGEGENYRQQMLFVGDHIKRIVDRLLDAAVDEQPVIIVAGDEGPFPVRYAADKEGFDWVGATASELETKYGILNAFYLPGSAPEGAPVPYPTISSWNTFPVVLGRYFGEAIPLLPDRSYTSKGWGRPYDLTEIDRSTARPLWEDRPSGPGLTLAYIGSVRLDLSVSSRHHRGQELTTQGGIIGRVQGLAATGDAAAAPRDPGRASGRHRRGPAARKAHTAVAPDRRAGVGRTALHATADHPPRGVLRGCASRTAAGMTR